MIRNSLLFRTRVEDIQGMNCCTPDVSGYTGWVVLCLNTLAMGDVCAVEIAQTSHVGILAQLGLITASSVMAMVLPVPKGPHMTGVVIDDLILFEVVAREAFEAGLETEKYSAYGSSLAWFSASFREDLFQGACFRILGLTPGR